MARTQTMVQLTERLREILDRQAERRGISRSALIRLALEEFISRDREENLGREIVEGYTRIPQVTPDDWGEPTAVTDHSTADVLRRLSAEERVAGHPPW